MPTYEYRCVNGHRFTKRQKISDRPVTKCPECAAHATRLISGGAGLVFKGTGFYITDYGKDGKGPAKPPPDAAARDKSSTATGGDKAPASPAGSTPAPASPKDSSTKPGE